MKLGEKLAAERKKKGVTQQQLAALTNLTVRTIQRIENGENVPRAFTITVIAEALGTTYTALYDVEHPAPAETQNQLDLNDEDRHSLQLINLSCFGYLLLPFIHFVVPLYVRKKTKINNERASAFARRMIREQIIWIAAINLSMLICLAFNLISAFYFEKTLIINFLWPFFLMYLVNAIVITNNFFRIKNGEF